MSFYLYIQQQLHFTLPSLTYPYLQPFNSNQNDNAFSNFLNLRMCCQLDTTNTVSPPILDIRQPLNNLLPSTLSEPTEGKRKTQRKRTNNPLKQLESAKKNSESNLMHQMLTYLSNIEKSQELVMKTICKLEKESSEKQKIQSIFFNTIRLINLKRGRKYVNRKSILNYYTPQSFELNLPGIRSRLDSMEIISLQRFCALFRVITYEFIRQFSIPAVLTSRKITMVGKFEHLKRRRQLQKLLEIQDSL